MPTKRTYHFCVLAARLSLAKSLFGSTVPRKMGLNYSHRAKTGEFHPALALPPESHLVHARVGKEERRVVMRDRRRRTHKDVLMLLNKVVDERVANTRRGPLGRHGYLPLTPVRRSEERGVKWSGCTKQRGQSEKKSEEKARPSTWTSLHNHIRTTIGTCWIPRHSCQRAVKSVTQPRA